MPEEEESNWKVEYEKRLRELSTQIEEDDRRQFPRHQFQDTTSALIAGPPHVFRIGDISVGGVAFLSETEMGVGTRLWLTAGNVVAVEVEVVRVHMEETDPDFLDYKYMVHARFVEEMDGYMAFVLFWDRDKKPPTMMA